MRSIPLVAILLSLGPLAAGAHAAWTPPSGVARPPTRVFAVFLVNSTDDADDGACNAGHCSLREAIRAANVSPGFDQIAFAIPGAGPHTIQPASAFPTVTDFVSIDGTTQPGYAGMPLIELDGQLVSNPMLRISCGGSTVRGLVINRADIGLRLETNGGNTVEACFFGTDVTGTMQAEPFNSNTGIAVFSSNNTIGGVTPAQRNIISGQSRGISIGFSPFTRIIGNYIGTDVTGTVALTLGNTNGIRSDGMGRYTIGGAQPGEGNLISGNGYGIVVLGGDSSGVVVQGNRIGTDASGTAALGNATQAILGSVGMTIGGTAPGTGNVISGNAAGAQLGSRNRVLGNFIGLDVTGTNALGNSGPLGFGVQLSGTDNVVGGTEPGARNVISGNGREGVVVQGFGATRNVIQGNYIGTDASGTLARGNFTGVSLRESGNLVGGTGPGQGNLISGNVIYGVELLSNATGNRIEGNRIGTDASGAGPLGNLYGVLIESSPGNSVGGPAPGAGNHIAWNSSGGVEFRSSSSAGNLVQGNVIVDNLGAGVHLSLTGEQNLLRTNSIARNAGLGIDLYPPDVTPNDSTDLDSGSNGLQNFPLVTLAWTDGLATHIEGSLQSRPNATYVLEFFASASCDPTGYGEGETPLGLATIATPGSGLAPFVVTLPAAPPIGSQLTATATDAAGSTSEFSACVTVQDLATPVALSLVRAEAKEREVRLEWYGAGATGLVVTVERWRASEGWRPIATPVVADRSGLIVYLDRGVAPATRYGYRLSWDDGGRRVESQVTWVETPAAAAFGLVAAIENPSRDAIHVRFSLDLDEPAALEVFDVSGRRRLRHAVGGLGRGVHDVRLGGATELGAGLYWVRLTQAGRTAVARAVVTP